MKLDNFSDLEISVMIHMIEEGLDPQNQEDIQKFWSKRLDESNHDIY